jgi:hypothetical protein
VHLAATLALVVALGAPSLAQVPVGKEPHHRIVHEDAHLRVLDVNIPPGVTTLDHSHDHDLVTVSIGQADTRIKTPGGDWGPVRPRRPAGDTSAVEYAGKQGVHTIQNVGPDPYRLLAVENVKQSGWKVAPAVRGPGVKVVAEARAFRASSVRLKAGATLRRAHAVPWVVVLISGNALVSAEGREPRRLDEATRWTVVGTAGALTMAQQGSGEAHLVEIEVF